MKKSKQVILTTAFLAAIAPATSTAQSVKDSVAPKPQPDSVVSFNDSTAYYKDSTIVRPQTNYVYTENTGFWWRFRLFFRFGHYGRHWEANHQYLAQRHRQPVPAVARATDAGPRAGVPVARSSMSAAPVVKKGGFGGTMRASTASAHS